MSAGDKPRPHLQRRAGYLYELPRVPKDDDPIAVIPAPRDAFIAEAAAIARVRTELPNARWIVGVDHRGAWANVDGHETRARKPCADVLVMALEKAIAARSAA